MTAAVLEPDETCEESKAERTYLQHDDAEIEQCIAVCLTDACVVQRCLQIGIACLFWLLVALWLGASLVTRHSKMGSCMMC